MKRFSVKVRLTLWYTLALTIAMVILAGALYAEMRKALETDLDADLRHNANALGERLHHEFEEGDEIVDASEDVVRKSLFQNVSLAVYRADGSLVAASPALEGLVLAPELALAEIAWLGTGVTRTHFADARLDPEGVEVAAVAVEHPLDGTRYTLVAGAGRSQLAATLALSRQLAFTLVPLLLLLAVVGGWVLASSALAPVGLMATQARRMSADRLGDRLDVPNPDDELGRLAAVFNELLDRIESAVDRMRQFVADASHELRTPVAVIRSGTAVALTEPVSLDECADTLRVIDDQAARLGRLVDDMFTLARADAGDPALLLVEDVPVGEVVTSCAAAAQTLASAAGVAITLSALPEVERYVRADSLRLKQMLMNLLTNAIRHAGCDGRVDVGLRFAEDGASAIVSVADTGPGIPADAREVIFDRFVRLDQARARATGGGGLGLPIARWIAAAHGGTIDVEDATIGGALFTVRMPLDAPPR